MITQNYSQGEVIFREGDVSTSIHQVSSGSVNILVAYQQDTEALLATKEAGAYFGELAGICALPRSATAIAATDCEVKVFQAEELVDVENPDFEFLNMVDYTLWQETLALLGKYLQVDIYEVLNRPSIVELCHEAYKRAPERYLDIIRSEIGGFQFIGRQLSYAFACKDMEYYENVLRFFMPQV